MQNNENNETILSNNELNLSKNEKSESNSDMVNDEFYPTIQAQKNSKENLELYQIEKCLNLLSLQMSQRKEKKIKKVDNEITPKNKEIKEKNDILLSKYKFIPKKHKYYLKYKYKEGKFIIQRKDKIYNHILEKDIDNYKNIKKFFLNIENKE